MSASRAHEDRHAAHAYAVGAVGSFASIRVYGPRLSPYGTRASLQGHPASFDKLRMRENLRGTMKDPHPELVEGRMSAIQVSCRQFIRLAKLCECGRAFAGLTAEKLTAQERSWGGSQGATRPTSPGGSWGPRGGRGRRGRGFRGTRRRGGAGSCSWGGCPRCGRRRGAPRPPPGRL